MIQLTWPIFNAKPMKNRPDQLNHPACTLILLDQCFGNIYSRHVVYMYNTSCISIVAQMTRKCAFFVQDLHLHAQGSRFEACARLMTVLSLNKGKSGLVMVESVDPNI